MKKLVFISLLVALSFSNTAMAASDESSVTISGAETRITLSNNYYPMRPDDFYAYKGSYDLSNGQTLTLSSRGEKMYAEVSQQGRHELVATANNSFTARDLKLKMTINLHEDAEPSGMLYMVVPAKQTAGTDQVAEQVIAIAFR